MRRTKNKFEERIRRQLVLSKTEFGYETHKIPYTIHGNYIPDFVLNIRGNLRILECKGYFRITDKRKLAAVKRCHPSLDIRIVFYTYKENNIKWANKHGFPYAIGEIPEEWLT